MQPTRGVNYPLFDVAALRGFDDASHVVALHVGTASVRDLNLPATSQTEIKGNFEKSVHP